MHKFIKYQVHRLSKASSSSLDLTTNFESVILICFNQKVLIFKEKEKHKRLLRIVPIGQTHMKIWICSFGINVGSGEQDCYVLKILSTFIETNHQLPRGLL